MTFVPKHDEFTTCSTFEAELSGTVNGLPISLSGGGSYDPDAGLTVGEYDLHEIPAGFSPFLLGVCLVTGYPNVCACKGATTNPFDDSPYHYEREISLGKFGQLRLKTNVRYSGKHLISQFRLEGEVSVPSLGQVEPFEEAWLFNEDSIGGNFVMRWPAAKGQKVEAVARSTYHPTNAGTKGAKMIRTLDLKTGLSGNRLSLHQLSSLRG